MSKTATLRILTLSLLLGMAGYAGADSAEPTDPDALREEMAQARSDLAEAAQRLASVSRQMSEQGLARRWAEMDTEQWRGMIGDLPDGAAIQRAVSMAWAPRLGILLGGADEDPAVNRVRGVTPGSNAAAAGVEVGDRLLSLDGVDISQRTGQTVRQLLRQREAGDTVTLELERNGERRSLALVLERPQMPGLAMFRADSESFNFEGLSDLMEGARQPGRALAFARRSNFSQMHAGLQPYFGVDHGVLVLQIEPDNQLKLEAGDVILAIDGQPVHAPAQLMRHLLTSSDTDSTALEIMRRGERMLLGGGGES